MLIFWLMHECNIVNFERNKIAKDSGSLGMLFLPVF